MRKLLVNGFIAGIFIVLAMPLTGQVQLQVNIGSQPIWGPTGYDYVEYYYLPDIETYYNVPQQRFFYFEGGRWINGSTLPSRFSNVNLYNSYKVVVNEREPWRNHETYRIKYASYKGRHDQQPIRDSRDSKYFVNKNHPEHGKWAQNQGHDGGNQNSGKNGNNGKGNDKNKAHK
jgi:hypothetical protein